jgi:hypothetical protein
MKLEIVIPSYKRPKKVITGKYLTKAKICVPESQAEEYRKYNKNELLILPDEKDGNVSKKRNWILNNVKADIICMIDDDVSAIAMYENDRRVILSEDEVEEFILKYSELAKEVGTVLWGVNLLKDRLAYHEYRPFNFLVPILGPFCVHINNPCRYDESLILKEDYDMSLQVIQRHRKLMRVNKFHYIVKQYRDRNEGGCTSYRSQEKEREQMRLLQEKWGKKIVVIPKNDINPLINIPIPGT